LHCRLRGTANQFDLALGRITEFDIKGNHTSFCLEIFDRPASNQILAGIRINDLRQGGLDCFYGDAHYLSLFDTRKSKPIGSWPSQHCRLPGRQDSGSMPRTFAANTA